MGRTWVAHARARWQLLIGPRPTGAPTRFEARLCEAQNTRQALRGSDGELAASDWASSSVESGSDTWLRMTQQLR